MGVLCIWWEGGYYVVKSEGTKMLTCSNRINDRYFVPIAHSKGALFLSAFKNKTVKMSFIRLRNICRFAIHSKKQIRNLCLQRCCSFLLRTMSMNTHQSFIVYRLVPKYIVGFGVNTTIYSKKHDLFQQKNFFFQRQFS